MVWELTKMQAAPQATLAEDAVRSCGRSLNVGGMYKALY